MPDETLPMIDLFAGAGGLSLGMSRAGFIPVGASEMDLDAMATYANAHERYRPDTALHLFEGDIAKHSFKRLRGEIAVVAGGPPCQPYSLGGARKGTLDDRDGIPHFIRAVGEIRPDAFVMENVPGLARGQQAHVLTSAIATFEELGYRVHWKLLHAADYGVSQRRQRLIIIGFRHAEFTWPAHTHGPSTDQPWVPASSILRPDKVMGIPNTAKVTYAKAPDLRPSPWDGHLWNGGGRPINPDGLVPTLLASMGGNKTPWLDAEDIVRPYHAELLAGGAPRVGTVPGARRITVEEAAIVQGFPADMPWVGPSSSRYRQIGNAVPVQLAEAVGMAVLMNLQEARAGGRQQRRLVA